MSMILQNNIKLRIFYTVINIFFRLPSVGVQHRFSDIAGVRKSDKTRIVSKRKKKHSLSATSFSWTRETTKDKCHLTQNQFFSETRSSKYSRPLYGPLFRV